MRIGEVFFIRQRGYVAYVTLDVVVGRAYTGTLRRLSDGATWYVRGVEWFALRRTDERPGIGEPVGLLLAGIDPPSAGDECALSMDPVPA